MATITVFPDANPESTSVDGHLQYDGATVWANAVARTTSDFTVDANADGQVNQTLGNGNGANFFTLIREFTLFDTSALGAGASIASAVLSIWGINNTFIGTEQPVYLVASTPSSNTSLTSTDFDNVGSTVFGQTPVPFDGTNTVYSDVTLNASGIAAISKTGITKFAWRGYYDINSIAPSASLRQLLQWNSADVSGTSTDPKLVITTGVPLAIDLSSAMTPGMKIIG